MKRMLFIIFVFVLLSTLSAQDASNGKISLMLDGEKIEVPISILRLQKGDNILVDAEGKSRNGDNRASILLQFSINDLKPQKVTPQNITMNITYKTTGMNQIHFSVRGNSGSYSNIGKQLTFTRVKTNCEITQMKYGEGRIKITGKFSGIFLVETDNEATSGKVKIKNGKFIIIF